ncbi:MAG: hypothetical protein MJ231_03115 [bacterium]|nr:hypothetical protein [bacterium]
MIDAIKQARRQGYKYVKAIDTIQNFTLHPELNRKTDSEFYIAMARYQKYSYNKDYNDFIEKFRPVIKFLRKKFGKEGMTKVVETFLDGDMFLNEFVKSLKSQQARLISEQKAQQEAAKKAQKAQRVILPITPSKIKS